MLVLLSAVGFVNIMMKGCLESSKCNKTDDVNFPSSSSNSTIYTMNKTCCDTNLCNAAPRAPGVPGVGLALATVTALFLAQAMAWRWMEMERWMAWAHKHTTNFQCNTRSLNWCRRQVLVYHFAASLHRVVETCRPVLVMPFSHRIKELSKIFLQNTSPKTLNLYQLTW